jgi:hypothetical protein
MERLVDRQTHQRFAAANQELSEFLRKVDGLANGTELITEHDLQSLSQRLSDLAPEVADGLKAQASAHGQQDELLEYIGNLRTLQTSLETVYCVMLARKVQLDGAKRHLHGLQGWVNAYNQTT